MDKTTQSSNPFAAPTVSASLVALADPASGKPSIPALLSQLREVLLGLGFPDSEIRNAGARFFAEAGHRLPVQNTPSDP